MDYHIGLLTRAISAFFKYLENVWVQFCKSSTNNQINSLTENILEKIAIAANDYKTELESLGAPKFIGAIVPPVANLVLEKAKMTQSWPEAINIIRTSKGAIAFRAWTREVVDCVSKGDAKARRELEKVGSFLKDWTRDPNEGVKYKSRVIKIAQVDKYLERAPKYEIHDPVFFQKRHIVFMSELFKSNIKITNANDFSMIKL